jgi:hypothetical protein
MTGFQSATLKTVPNRRFWHVGPAGRCYGADDDGRFVVEYQEDINALLALDCKLIEYVEQTAPLVAPAPFAPMEDAVTIPHATRSHEIHFQPPEAHEVSDT